MWYNTRQVSDGKSPTCPYQYSRLRTAMDTPDITTLKRCSKCGETKPRDCFSKDKKRPDGLQRHCKVCNAAYRNENKDRINHRGREYYASNRDVIVIRAHDWYHNNKERASGRDRNYYLANRDTVLLRGKNYRRAHAEEIKARQTANRERILKTQANYRETNKDKRTSYSNSPQGRSVRLASKHRRKARKLFLPELFTKDDWQFALDFFSGCCAVCGRPPGLWHTLAADHWIPLSASNCPGTVVWNIVPLCHGAGGCNNSKGNRDAADWLLSKFGRRGGGTIMKRIEAFLESRKHVG